MQVYQTRKGILVYGDGTRWEHVHGPKFMGWKVPCWRADNGRWCGWRWLDSLQRIDS